MAPPSVLKVTNLSNSTDAEHLKEVFGQYGRCEAMVVRHEENEHGLGYGYVFRFLL